jgi:A/G-specific adenine glycosylase
MIEFKKKVWNYYRKNRREMAWRNTTDPYRILVSEVMLQQTQVARVLVKYPEFIAAFPTFQTLDSASLSDVLKIWKGMGYNRRALYLKKIAEIICAEYDGIFPDDPHVLVKLPGIGAATSCSIVTFAWNKPTIFIETNIRRVFIHHLFKDQRDVTDALISPLIASTLDIKNPREWYYALMDYGAMLGATQENANRRSKHYIKQSAFEGSNRQVRAAVLHLITSAPQSLASIIKELPYDKEKIKSNIEALQKEGFVVKKGKMYRIVS